MKPDWILDVKEKQLRHRTIREALVQWKGYPIADASWGMDLDSMGYLPTSKSWFITAARLAQSVERETLTTKRHLKAAGSTPALGSIPYAQA